MLVLDAKGSRPDSAFQEACEHLPKTWSGDTWPLARALVLLDRLTTLVQTVEMET
jgi:hypothetical protein